MIERERTRWHTVNKLLRMPGFRLIFLESHELGKVRTNHPVDKSRVQQRKQDIKNGGCAPIILGKDYFLLDGCCRLAAYKELGYGTLALITTLDKDWYKQAIEFRGDSILDKVLQC